VALRGQLAADRLSSRPARPARARSSPARLLEHLGAGLQPVPQLVPLAGRRMSVSWRYCPMPGSGLVVSGRTSPIPGSRRIREAGWALHLPRAGFASGVV